MELILIQEIKLAKLQQTVMDELDLDSMKLSPVK
jgi:hypothetical protein